LRVEIVLQMMTV